jgi:hypothetical protein
MIRNWRGRGMLGHKEREQLELFITGSLRQLVPDDHVLVRGERSSSGRHAAKSYAGGLLLAMCETAPQRGYRHFLARCLVLVPLAETKPRASLWMQHSGLEWLRTTAAARRYLVYNAISVVRVRRQLAGWRSYLRTGELAHCIPALVRGRPKEWVRSGEMGHQRLQH